MGCKQSIEFQNPQSFKKEADSWDRERHSLLYPGREAMSFYVVEGSWTTFDILPCPASALLRKGGLGTLNEDDCLAEINKIGTPVYIALQEVSLKYSEKYSEINAGSSNKTKYRDLPYTHCFLTDKNGACVGFHLNSQMNVHDQAKVAVYKCSLSAANTKATPYPFNAQRRSRAHQLLGLKNFSFYLRNSEHVVNYILHGEWHSTQVDRLRDIFLKDEKYGKDVIETQDLVNTNPLYLEKCYQCLAKTLLQEEANIVDVTLKKAPQRTTGNTRLDTNDIP